MRRTDARNSCGAAKAEMEPVLAPDHASEILVDRAGQIICRPIRAASLGVPVPMRKGPSQKARLVCSYNRLHLGALILRDVQARVIPHK